MSRALKTLFALALGASVTVSACKKEESAPAKDKAATPDEGATKPEPTAAPDKPTETAVTGVAAVMKHYETCRALLAADKAEGIAECAAQVAEAAKAAEAGAPDAAKGHLIAISTAAGALAKLPADDIGAVRLAFGTVSEPVVAMLIAIPEAAADYHVFECPMAKGYQRWVQPDDKLENPYRGASMLTCGSEVHDHHGMKKDGDKEGTHDHKGTKKGAEHTH
jgi:hypothetical protein